MALSWGAHKGMVQSFFAIPPPQKKVIQWWIWRFSSTTFFSQTELSIEHSLLAMIIWRINWHPDQFEKNQTYLVSSREDSWSEAAGHKISELIPFSYQLPGRKPPTRFPGFSPGNFLSKKNMDSNGCHHEITMKSIEFTMKSIEITMKSIEITMKSIEILDPKIIGNHFAVSESTQLGARRMGWWWLRLWDSI